MVKRTGKGKTDWTEGWVTVHIDRNEESFLVYGFNGKLTEVFVSEDPEIGSNLIPFLNDATINAITKQTGLSYEWPRGRK